ncbi:MAG: PAS domain S-box protein, partial [bacterium]
SEERYEALIETSLDGFWVVDIEGRLIEVNDAYCLMTGYTREKLLSMSVSDLEVIETPEKTREHIEKLVAQGWDRFESKHRCSDGKIINVVISTIYLSSQNIILVFIDDITEQKQSERLLRLSEEKLRAISQTANDAIVTSNSSGIIEGWNNGAEKIFGYKENEVLGQSLVCLIHETYKEAHVNGMQRLAAGGESQLIGKSIELIGLHKNGTVFPMELSLAEWETSTGKYYTGIIRDITYRKQVEESLKKSEEKFRLLFDTIPDAIIIHDLEGHILQVNRMACKRLGYSNEELLQMTVKEIDSPKFTALLTERMTQFLQVGYAVLETEHLSKDGVVIPTELSSRVIEYEGKPAVLSVARDISERKQIEEKLIVQSTALNSAANSIVITDITGKIEWVNPAFTKLTGYIPEEVTGENPRTLKSGKQDAAFYKNLWDTILAGEVWYGEMINKRKDGSEYNEEMTITPVKDENGEITRFIAIKQDITERKKFEEELSKAKTEAEQANLAKSEFLSRMSHELRTPMNSILGFAQLMDMGELTPAHKKGVNHILKSGTHLLDLINEVLDLSRIEAGKLSLSIEPVQLRGIILETVDIVRPLAARSNVKLELINSVTNDLFVEADRLRLKQALLNLITNATKYNREGGSVTIECSDPRLTSHISRPTSLIRISVTDTGIGISPENLEKLFTPFKRIDAEKTQVEGTGLGLTVVKKLMEAMYGTIGVESEEGKGSTFWIELPQGESTKGLYEQADKPATKEAGITRKTGLILYIEDNVANIQLVEQILVDHRPAIRLITNIYGKRAMKFATDYKPDLILLDLDLPDIEGAEVLKLLQADPKTKAIPVVVLTADATPRQIEKLLKAGAKEYLTKPLDVVGFLNVVDEMLGT